MGRHLAVCLALAVPGCVPILDESGDGGSSTGAGSTYVFSSSSSKGGSSSTTGASGGASGGATSSSTASSTAASTASSASTRNGSSSGGSSSSNDCGADSCVPCPCGYVAADSCLNGGWQCGCAAGSGSSQCGGSSDKGSGSGGSSSTSCGADTCGPCPQGCAPFDTCGARGWQCTCGCTASSGGTSSSSSGGSSSTVACTIPAGGVATLVGSWSGVGTGSENFSGMGGGSGGPEKESVVAIDGGVEFQSFFNGLLVNCALPFTLTGPTSADVVAASTCTDSSKALWTFTSGSATLDSTGCVMTVQTAGTIADPSMGPGTFTTSSTLDLQ